MATTTSESEEERKTSKVRKKVRKEENKRCYMHLSSVNNEDVQHFTRTRWDTYRNYLKQWLCLQDQNKHLAEIYKHCSDVDFDAIPDDAGFHATCYRRFTDKSALFYAEKRTARAVGEPSAAAGLPVASAGPVLPAICIICQKVEKYTRVGGKRQRDQLTQAETVSAGQLLKAAEIKKDAAILLHINDKDCVAIEVRYHRTCYRQYTRFLSLSTATHTATRDEEIQPFADSYNLFCDQVIRQRIIIDKEVLRMDKLRKLFVDTVKKHEDLDASGYSKYVCHLYGQASAKDVNDARYKAFCMASSALPELSIPPTSDALHQHCKRANYQAAVMRHSLTGMMCAPSPIGNGWYIEDGELTVRWMTRNPAPDSVLQVVHCGCKTSKCETERCSCMSAKMSCTDVCHCQNCGNVSKETEERGAWDDDTDESDIDE
ncbi:uncharacterized protein LOC133660711 isoform X2 [Entelurus aequoreus]|uniref:uncharacterized protein LOC133660711 isoform X2 n=1 Tax=Entelurus aequoreus TaxID=161455 RepID=UPI002B1D6D6D|nr:uncharacterized protein LOC133660711 isoform X2 [Entelurus aequoreus]